MNATSLRVLAPVAMYDEVPEDLEPAGPTLTRNLTEIGVHFREEHFLPRSMALKEGEFYCWRRG